MYARGNVAKGAATRPLVNWRRFIFVLFVSISDSLDRVNVAFD